MTRASGQSGLSKRVLLTGATGFVGSHMHERLVAHGFEVIGGTRKPDEARAKSPDRAFVEIDLGDHT